jgi:hypothetical protein
METRSEVEIRSITLAKLDEIEALLVGRRLVAA